MIYKPAKGARLTIEQAQRYGERIEALIEGNNGTVTPEQVLRDAEEWSSPLHDYFEWSDSMAATKWRLTQARYLMRSIYVTIEREDGQEEARALYNVYVTPDGSDESLSVYVAIQQVLDDEGLRQQVIEKALRSLLTWQKKYKLYKEFSSIFTEIDTLQQTPLFDGVT